jgi:hypothetical protein
MKSTNCYSWLLAVRLTPISKRRKGYEQQQGDSFFVSGAAVISVSAIGTAFAADTLPKSGSVSVHSGYWAVGDLLP